MQSENKESFLNFSQKSFIILFCTLIFCSLFVFKNLVFKSSLLLKNFGELSINPELAFTNNKPTFLEFYAEWCEVCREMAPKVDDIRKEYEKDINFVFLNVDNQRWEKYIRKYNVNGIPQVNIFDKKGNLKSTFIGKQEETKIRDSLAYLEVEPNYHEEILNDEFSVIKENKIREIKPRSHG